MIEVTGDGGLGGPARSGCKRMLDVLGAMGLLIFFAPISVVALAGLRLMRDGPIFTHEDTVGLNGKMFRRWRLYRPEAGGTVFDRLLWRAGLADLPAAVNVILGDMSLVGPQPHSKAHSAHMGRRRNYAARFVARPGMVWPRDRHGQPSLAAELDYLAAWTTWLDLKLAGLHAINGLLREEPGVS